MVRIGAVLLGIVFVVAGVLKMAHPGSLHLFQSLGIGSTDPRWIAGSVSVAEVVVGLLLMSGWRTRGAVVAAACLASTFSLYHLALGLGMGAHT